MKLRTAMIAFLAATSPIMSLGADTDCQPKVFQPQPKPLEIKFDNGLQGEFFRNAFVPRSDNLGRYQYYPGTGYFVGEANLNKIIYDGNNIENPSTTEAKRYVFHWANRCNMPLVAGGCGSSKEAPGVSNLKGNLPEMNFSGHGKKRFFFTTYDRANMCTLAQAQNLLGVDNNTISAFLERWDLTEANTEQQVLEALEAPDSGGILKNVCYLYEENGQLSSHINGFVLDYEVQDHRADFKTTNFIARYSNFVRAYGKTPILWTNPVLSAGWQRSGFSSGANGNAHKVLLPTTPTSGGEAGMGMELTSLLVYDGSVNVANELDMQSRALFLTNYDYNRFFNRQKMYVTVGIKGFTLEKAQQVREFVSDRKLKGIATWNNNQDFRGTDCGDEYHYQVVNCMALGGDHCSGS